MKIIVGSIIAVIVLVVSWSSWVRAQALSEREIFQGVSRDDRVREDNLTVLRAQAKERIAADQTVYSAQELNEIEFLYRSAHHPYGEPVLLNRDAEPRLRALIDKFPHSNRAGCAVVQLA